MSGYTYHVSIYREGGAVKSLSFKSKEAWLSHKDAILKKLAPVVEVKEKDDTAVAESE